MLHVKLFLIPKYQHGVTMSYIFFLTFSCNRHSWCTYLCEVKFVVGQAWWWYTLMYGTLNEKTINADFLSTIKGKSLLSIHHHQPVSSDKIMLNCFFHTYFQTYAAHIFHLSIRYILYSFIISFLEEFNVALFSLPLLLPLHECTFRKKMIH